MQPLIPTPTTQMVATQQSEPAKASSAEDTTPALNRADQLILNYQERILSVVSVVECLARGLGENLPDTFKTLASEFDNLCDDQEKADHLKKTVYALENYFPTSKIYRKDGQERREAVSGLNAIKHLDSKNKQLLIETLRKECNVEESIPLKITENSYAFVFGATVPGMQNRLNFLSCEIFRQPYINPVKPQQLFGLVSSRPLCPKKDKLKSEKLNQYFQLKCEASSRQFSLSGNENTEAHGFMALTDTLGIWNKNHVVMWPSITVCYSGPLAYWPQDIQPDGNYILQKTIQHGRANTEATIMSALKSLNLPDDAELVLVSSQPHVTGQQIAAERVAALLNLQPRITAGGRRKPVQDDNSIFQAIDALRKSIQLLNPNYHITTNQTSAPESLLIKSPRINMWHIQRKLPEEIMV